MAAAPYPNFWVRKMRSFFVLFDRDLDGLVNKKDYVDWIAGRVGQFMPKEKAEAYTPLWSAAWDFYWADKAVNDNVNIDDMIQIHSRYLSDPNFHESAEQCLAAFFDSADANSDGMISLSEYTAFLECYGVHPLSVTPSFEALDTNHDGMISKEEFVKAGTDYFQVTADTPAKLFWGPFRG
ncbi:sarcoplasmic calcium-binding protein-like [Lingula anatina]|uniref:Sarcoplasmic calcium-binding protein-like n=1 Tax=Lingula anatina TaxID=7574 RepID=A0A1S3HEN3_LINAN|nr:sarcoplasmic calcium-binding protein-like [Lingula anatina]XP_013384539.1 sarcoplasmic calcium-binding protein-like [Lingula anatina]|eukprot:XP_013384537.1 sarcoplasmic calcium-binding protein-like [Lingula anatina]